MSKQNRTRGHQADVMETGDFDSGPQHEAILIEVLTVDYDTRTHYATRHINVNLTPDEARALEMTRLGLVSQLATLPGGRMVQTPADVVRWLASQIAGLGSPVA